MKTIISFQQFTFFFPFFSHLHHHIISSLHVVPYNHCWKHFLAINIEIFQFFWISCLRWNVLWIKRRKSDSSLSYSAPNSMVPELWIRLYWGNRYVKHFFFIILEQIYSQNSSKRTWRTDYGTTKVNLACCLLTVRAHWIRLLILHISNQMSSVQKQLFDVPVCLFVFEFVFVFIHYLNPHLLVIRDFLFYFSLRIAHRLPFYVNRNSKVNGPTYGTIVNCINAQRKRKIHKTK